MGIQHKNDLPLNMNMDYNCSGERNGYMRLVSVFNKGGELEYLEGIILDISGKRSGK